VVVVVEEEEEEEEESVEGPGVSHPFLKRWSLRNRNETL
jgi:hypothetical protein